MLLCKIIGSIVGEIVRGLPLWHRAGAHIDTPLHSDPFSESSPVNFSPDLKVNLHKPSHQNRARKPLS